MNTVITIVIIPIRRNIIINDLRSTVILAKTMDVQEELTHHYYCISVHLKIFDAVSLGSYIIIILSSATFR